MRVQLVVCGPQRCLEYRRGSEAGGSILRAQFGCHPCLSLPTILSCFMLPHTLLLYPFFSPWSDLSSCCQFCSPHWTGRCAFAGIQADTSVSGAGPGAVQTVGAGTSQRAGSEARCAFLTGVRMGFWSPLN